MKNALFVTLFSYLFVPVVKTANLKISEARLQGNGKLKKEYVANALTR
jgi:hypothetical protein